MTMKYTNCTQPFSVKNIVFCSPPGGGAYYAPPFCLSNSLNVVLISLILRKSPISFALNNGIFKPLNFLLTNFL